MREGKPSKVCRTDGERFCFCGRVGSPTKLSSMWRFLCGTCKISFKLDRKRIDPLKDTRLKADNVKNTTTNKRKLLWTNGLIIQNNIQFIIIIKTNTKIIKLITVNLALKCEWMCCSISVSCVALSHHRSQSLSSVITLLITEFPPSLSISWQISWSRSLITFLVCSKEPACSSRPIQNFFTSTSWVLWRRIFWTLSSLELVVMQWRMGKLNFPSVRSSAKLLFVV